MFFKRKDAKTQRRKKKISLFSILFATLRLCVFALIFSPLHADEQELANRVHTHLFIHDPATAIVEAKRFLKEYPDSKELQFALIRALCEKGEDSEAISVWKKETGSYDRKILELLGWGVLRKSDFSLQQFVRISSLIGIALTKDAKAIPILLSNLRSSSALFRTLAIRLSATYRDEPLRDELLRLLKQEKVWYVRLEVIKAVGQMGIFQAKEQLKEIIGHRKTLAEEKSAALIALASMYEAVEDSELKALVKSDRAGLRQLACEVVSFLDLRDKVHFILPLLKDASPDVRISALTTLGLAKTNLIACLEDTNPPVAITAGWLAILQDDKRGEEVLKRSILGDNPEHRRMASAALAKTGNHGAKLAWKMLKASEDPYVRVNLAIGLIGVRDHVDKACSALHVALRDTTTKWMWEHENHFLFRSLAPSKVVHIDQIPNYPTVVDQMARLELLSLLSVMRYPQSLEAVKEFLKNSAWGVSGSAAVTLIQEGDEFAFDAVKELLEDKEEKIRIQAALILAMVGNEPKAVEVLQAAYEKADREMKIHILEALGHIGDAKSIPFLMDVLNEPFQVLRVVAASALIQCLYH